MNLFERAWNWTWSRFFRLLGDAHRHFGNRYSNRKEYEAAVANYTRAAMRDPDYADAFFNRGVLYWREFGDYAPSITDLTRALELDPLRSRVYFNRAIALRMSGEYAQAIPDFERYLEEGEDEFFLSAARKQLVELRSEITGSTEA